MSKNGRTRTGENEEHGMSKNIIANDLSGGQASAASQQAKDHYPYTILHKITSFLHYFSSPPTTDNQSYLQGKKPDTATVKEKQEEIKVPFLKRILVVDDRLISPEMLVEMEADAIVT